jgi:hypothetical protein
MATRAEIMKLANLRTLLASHKESVTKLTYVKANSTDPVVIERARKSILNINEQIAEINMKIKNLKY